MIEVHPNPAKALSGWSPQIPTPDRFDRLMQELAVTGMLGAGLTASVCSQHYQNQGLLNEGKEECSGVSEQGRPGQGSLPLLSVRMKRQKCFTFFAFYFPK